MFYSIDNVHYQHIQRAIKLDKTLTCLFISFFTFTSLLVESVTAKQKMLLNELHVSCIQVLIKYNKMEAIEMWIIFKPKLLL